MCKENSLVHQVGKVFVDAQKKANAKGQFKVMRKGKTRKDKLLGSWGAGVANKAAKALENKEFHGK